MACSAARAVGRRADAAVDGGGIMRESTEVPLDGRRGVALRGDTLS